MIQISCHNVSIGYEKKLVLDDISFEIDSGDYLCIVGENGSGKTTLMKGLLGLLPLRTGKISFGDGVSRTGIGYLPQRTLIQKDFPASVTEVVLSGCLNKIGWKPFFSSKEKDLALEHMKRMGIDSFKNRPYRVLSGGQQQRVLLARALCSTEQILLLDEPTAGLDPVATQELYQTIMDLNQSGITIVMISHDITSAIQSANKILHLNTTVDFFGSTEDYRNSKCGAHFMEKGGKRHD